jgi:hypothetical protein
MGTAARERARTVFAVPVVTDLWEVLLAEVRDERAR